MLIGNKHTAGDYPRQCIFCNRPEMLNMRWTIMYDIAMKIADILLRTVISFVVLFLLSRLIGVRQISQMTFYDYIVGITIGSIAATLTLDQEIPIYYALIAMVAYALLTVVVSRINLKSIKARRFFSGTPSILINKGTIIEKTMKQNHYNINDLLEECRQKGYFNITDIDYAIMESNGHVSILPKSTKRPVQPDDMGITPESEGLTYNLIIDGQILYDNLDSLGREKQWLLNQLKEQKVADISSVLLASADQSGNLTVFRKNLPLKDGDHFI